MVFLYLIHCGVQEPMRVIALSALVLPLGFIAQVAYQHHPPSSGEYAKVPWGTPGRRRRKW